MATTLSNGGGSFKQHEPGTFMATCCDVFTMEFENKYKGTKNDRGQIDNRDKVEKVCISFLTTETIEVDGKKRSQKVSFWGSASWGRADYPSGTRNFVKTWMPKITDAIIANGFDMDRLIGQSAWITVAERGSKGNTYVISAVTPPPGMGGPAIPADFVRHKDKALAADIAADAEAAHHNRPQAAPVKASPAPVAQADNEDDLPF